jgi:peptidoglycan/LPS O-acetylase OafA/YrhL
VIVGHVVLLGHLPWTGINLYGYWVAELGVFVFFAISGFLLYRPFIAARATTEAVNSLTPPFLVRRFVRIFPAYWAALTLLAIWPGLIGVFGDQWWVSYGLLRIYSPHWDAFGIGPAWTLSSELAFYLTLPLAAWLLQRRGLNSGAENERRWELGTIGLLAILSLAWRSVLLGEPNREYLSAWLPGTFCWFAVGMFLAAADFSPGAAFARLRSLLSRPEICWPLAIAILISMVEFPLGGTRIGGVAARGIANVETLAIAALLFAPAVFGDRLATVRTVLANRAIVFLGMVSYGMYLWHFPFVYWFRNNEIVTGATHPLLVLFVCVFVVAVAVGTLSWYLVERPLMRLVRSSNVFARKGPESAASPVGETVAEPAP